MTTMIRWNPMREMFALQNALDRMMDDTRRTARPAPESYSLPVDVYESDTAYHLVASLPGVGADNIQIHWHDHVLTVAAELTEAQPQGDNLRAHLTERTSGKVSRSLRLNRAVDPNAVEAVYEHGVLTLTLPKTPEAQPKLIPVRGMISPN